VGKEFAQCILPQTFLAIVQEALQEYYVNFLQQLTNVNNLAIVDLIYVMVGNVSDSQLIQKKHVLRTQ